MAQTTPNFGFNIAEGTDTVNLLTQCYPNFTSLDSILQGVKETGITTAVATKTGTNFAVVRTDTDCNVFRFIATANYAAGDTFTVDGVAVTATSPAGTALPGGAFVINQSVIAILNSSVLTVLAGGASDPDAADVDYDNTGSGLTATDVQAAIDEVVGDIPTGFAATAITYDNTVSGLTATTAQAAIDELAAGSETYVSAETAIGKWIDGSTIYRKCYEASGTFSSSFNIDNALNANNARIINLYGSVSDASPANYAFVQSASGGSPYNVYPELTSTAFSMHINNTTTNHYIVVIEYVKLA